MYGKDPPGPAGPERHESPTLDQDTVSSARSRVRFDLSIHGDDASLFQPPTAVSSSQGAGGNGENKNSGSGTSIRTIRTGSISGTPLSASPTGIMSERGYLGENPQRSYGSTTIDASHSLPSSVFSSIADLRHAKSSPHDATDDSSYPHDDHFGPGGHYDSSSSSFPARIARGISGWIGDTGISYDFRLPPKASRRDHKTIEEGTALVREGSHHSTIAGGGSGSEETEEGGWWSERLGQEGLILPLLIITFSCALADAGTLIHFSTFATSMTGNTVLVAVALMKATNKSPLYAAVALVGFIGTGLITGQLGAAYGNRSRSWLMSSMVFQIIILVFALGLVSPRGPLDVGHELDWVYVLFIGIQGGAQVTMAANSGARELPTAMMTTPYAAFVSDPTLFRFGANRDVRARNRRFIYILTFWIGSFLGAAIARWSTLWVMTAIVLACKVVVAGMIAITKGEPPEVEIERQMPLPKLNEEEDAERRSIRNEQRRHGERVRRRASSVFERLQDQEPRDERDVAF